MLQKLQKKNCGGNTNYSAKMTRRYCLTINNYTIGELLHVTSIFQKKNYKYIVGQETGKKNLTKHLQIYFESKNPIRFSTVKNMFPRAHIEKAIGNRKQNIVYCSKDGNYETNFNTDFLKKKFDENFALLREYERIESLTIEELDNDLGLKNIEII